VPYRMYAENDASAKCAHLFSVRDRWSQAGTMVSHAATVAAAVACDCGGATSSEWGDGSIGVIRSYLPDSKLPVGGGG
jgi:hypothetical protein